MAMNQVFEPTSQQSSFTLLNAPAEQYANIIDDYLVEELSSVLYFLPEALFSQNSQIEYDAIFDLSVHNPVNGDVHWNGKQVMFVPDAGFSGPASFDYTVIDNQGSIDSATVHLTIWQIQE